MPNTSNLSAEEYPRIHTNEQSSEQTLEEQSNQENIPEIDQNTAKIQAEVLDHIFEQPAVAGLEDEEVRELEHEFKDLPTGIGSEEAMQIKESIREERAYLEGLVTKLMKEMTKERFIPEWVQNMVMSMAVTAALAHGVYSGKLKGDTLDQLLKSSFEKIEHNVQK